MFQSIFLRITLFFLVTFVAMWIGFFAIHQKLIQEQTDRLEKEGGDLLLVLRQSVPLELPLRRTFLQEHGYSIAEPHPALIQTLRNAFEVIPTRYPEEIKDSMREGRIQILKDDNHLYIYLTKATPPLLVIKADVAKAPLWPDILFVSLSVALVLLYWLIIKTLFPLKTITQAITRYGSEGVYTPIQSRKKDEISLVSRALDSAMEKNQALLEARKLFLRNIMHELKTPITVGKLSLPFIKKSEEKSILERAFFRMEHLIAELVRLEQITSGSLAPHLQTCDPKALLERAKGLLFLRDEAIELSIDGTPIVADCEVMVTVFKNLIDNAIKYSSEGKVYVSQTKECIVFSNRGEAWPSGCTLQSLSEPFLHQHENQNSFGLGLYIIKSILDAHNFTLNYRYEEGFHRFEAVCLNPLCALD
ncbi:ArsS family sensor histidine kinase [Sulfuricurvum sp.]|uniref:ArsS family sensor histidine kinase n=1 Tax=Sulfuricurvum sp. TaxID=2025608 RepID=UPI002E34E2A4|nr:ArsS family sensor histidine kinase [Sulfuricurvum sp.]HEX5330392.1 ArsS family sensor histidine kinase [Sulfuricurvum sp.]